MLGLNSGLIGARRVSTTGNASGLWTPNEQSLAKRAGIWYGPDPNWSDVRLYLPMTGSNNGTTFADVSSNNRPITRVGGPVTSTTRYPFTDGTSSALFQSDGDYLDTTLSSALSTGDWTLETFFYPVTLTKNATIACFYKYAYSNGLLVGVDTNGAVFAFSDAGAVSIITSSTIPTGSWRYLAWVKSGSTLTIYIDGTSAASGSFSLNLNNAEFRVGSNSYGNAHDSGGNWINGNLSHLRLTATARTIAGRPLGPFPFG